MEIVVKNSQCLLDIALQAFGSAEAVFDIAALNGISITDDLNAGQVLKIPVERVRTTIEALKEYAKAHENENNLKTTYALITALDMQEILKEKRAKQ